LTVAGLRRRGFTPEILRQFASSSSDEQQLDRLFDLAREHFDGTCCRRMIVISPLVCQVENFEDYVTSLRTEDDKMAIVYDEQGCPKSVNFKIPNHPLKSQMGLRNVVLEETILINSFDFKDISETSKHYLTLGGSVYLKYISTLMTASHLGDDKLCVTLRYQPKRTKKIKAITWLSKPASAHLNIYENILSDQEIEPMSPLLPQINQNSLLQTCIYIDSCVLNEMNFNEKFSFNQTFQAERFGYLTADRSDSSDPHFNMTCFLRLHPDMMRNIRDACLTLDSHEPIH